MADEENPEEYTEVQDAPDDPQEEPNEIEDEEEPPPEPPPVSPKMYLLEIVVDDISLDFCNTKQLICFGPGGTIVELQFLDMGPMRICEDDFTPVKKRFLEGCTGTGNIKNGKSLLFGLTPEQAEEVSQKAIIYCDFIKKTDRKEYRLGSCMIPLINMFMELLKMVDGGNQPYYHKNIKDFYRIKDSSNEVIGHVYAYIRLSCFNEVIINKIKKDPNAQLDYTPELGVYQYKYNRSQTNIDAKPMICDCDGNKGMNKVCECGAECPHKTCPQVYTDNKCIYDCPQTLRPCQDCPPTCAANRAAGNIRTRTVPFMEASKSRSSKKSNKSGKSGKGGKKKK